jgi:poly(beta-D-mannuronate) lyase
MAHRLSDLRDDVAATPPPRVAWLNHDRLDLTGYRVTNRDAGLFDVGARMGFLQATPDPALRQAIDAAPAAPFEVARALPTLTYVGYIPRFYVDRENWNEATRDLLAIEQAVAGLAAAFVASGERSHADCLVDLLAKWAESGALTRFHFTPDEPQAWFALEATLFAIGISYAVVRPFVGDRALETATIEAWLARASRRHLTVKGQRANWWNNHYYRRALHAAAIGVVAGDDALFRYGVSAVHNALAELRPDGGLPRELSRGQRAVHYQNYALLYIIPIMEIAARQGYPLWDLAPAGRSIHDAVGLTVELLANPELARRYTRRPQDLSFMAQAQYFAWMEIYCARFDDSRVEEVVAPYRPVWSRASIGAATLYFYDPAPARRGNDRGE